MPLTGDRRWYAGAFALIGAGVLLIIAAAVRWSPCLTGAAAICESRQTHPYDYLLPVAPHQTSLGSTIPAALALALIAIAPLTLVGRRQIRPWLSRLTLIVLIGKPALFALIVAGAPIFGGLERPLLWVLLLEIAADLVIIVLVLATPNHLRQDYQRLLLLAVAVWASGWVGRVIDEILTSLANPDAEVPPGSGLIAAVAIAACGVGLALITREDARRPGRRV